MDIINGFFKSLPTDTALYFTVGVIVISFALCLILSLAVKNAKNYCAKLFAILSLSVCALKRHLEILSNDQSESAFIFAVAILLNIPFIFLKDKKTTAKEHKDFIKFIDGKIASETEERKSLVEKSNDESGVKDYPVAQEENVKDGLDFSHVRNILRRLDYFDLNQGDRRQVRELESTLFQAEHGYADKETKEKLNDGLGALLKIMARYGV